MAEGQGASVGGARARLPRVRRCLAAGCERRYRPRCWHQRYCGDVECRRRVRRWQAARRQRERRSTEEGREAHRLAEAARRQRRTVEAVARGHAARGPLCDRPACFVTVSRTTPTAVSCCSEACRTAIRRVLDREHKWLVRGALRGEVACERELERRCRARDRRRERAWHALLEARRHADRKP